MGVNKFEDRNIRKLTKIAGGASYGVTLPIEYVREFKWREHQKLVIKKVGKRLIIEDWKR
ncbi:AbrB/MazE/SpoVT family DNA-binding domain-containing protein [Candidatus Pacebacteria bacterium]|nr:AbrB/MazE/SpoVT family DNA-binding domain-containing protein [Candidatus Paceibacterota bacterium]